MERRLLIFLLWLLLLLLLLSSHAATAFRFTVKDFPAGSAGFTFGSATAAFQVP
jgi:beta-glucosidase